MSTVITIVTILTSNAALLMITFQTVVATHFVTLRKFPLARNTGCALSSVLVTGGTERGAVLVTLLSKPVWDAGCACTSVLVTGGTERGAVLVTLLSKPVWDAGCACTIVLVTGGTGGRAVLVTVVTPFVERTG